MIEGACTDDSRFMMMCLLGETGVLITTYGGITLSTSMEEGVKSRGIQDCAGENSLSKH